MPEALKEITSRGDEDEHIYAIANLLNAEEHITEAMTKDLSRSEELAKLLDDIRRTRQELVKSWAKGRADSRYWCALKHMINTCYHLHELITNAAREKPERVEELAKLLKECVEERDKLTKLFLSGSGSGECPRCASDLDLAIRLTNIPHVEEKKSDNILLNIILISIILFILLLLARSSTHPSYTQPMRVRMPTQFY